MSFKHVAKIAGLGTDEVAYRLTDDPGMGAIVAVRIESRQYEVAAALEAPPMPALDARGHFACLRAQSPSVLRRTAYHRVTGRWIHADGTPHLWPSGQPVTALHRHTCHGDTVTDAQLIAELLDGAGHRDISPIRRAIAAAQSVQSQA